MIHLVADLHTHTIASGHALATMNEMLQKAQWMGYEALAITDHGPKTTDVANNHHREVFLQDPNVTDYSVLLLKGIEANVTDAGGGLDVSEKQLPRFDWVVASMHKVMLAPMSRDEATNCWLRIAENPYVDMIGHSEEKEYYFDYERVTKAFAKAGKVVEVNAASPQARPGNEENQRQLVRCCKANGTLLAVCSDAHSTRQMEVLEPMLEMLEELQFPEEQIVNASMDLLWDVLARHGRPLAQHRQSIERQLAQTRMQTKG